ncbi:MAG TPA: carbohydrate porin [Gemmatimonadales bacterium]|nr:carbohydrate porin [Gemmatimonadales bacterium]
MTAVLRGRTSQRSWRAAVLVLVMTLSRALPVSGQSPAPPRWIPQLLGAQLTVIVQYLPRFPAQYNGPQSLTDSGDFQGTHTYGAYLGSQLTRYLQAYLDVEMARGGAIGNAFGLGGVSNGDVIRQGTVELGQAPYLARAFVRWVVPLSQGLDTARRAMDQLPGSESVARVEIKLGKLALTDDFDQNRYANTTRAQFCNWGLFNNTAWDYAADTRGYSYGIAVGWVHPGWTLRFGGFLMPTFANGNRFDWDVRRAHGDNLELTMQAPSVATVLRFLAYENYGRMGNYADAVSRARTSGQTPDIVADDQPGRRKYGFGVNVEQPLADSGETGAFVRLGWNDGRTEDFVFTEVDRHLSAGMQLSGVHWGRTDDRLGLGALRHGLSPEHAAYLAAGGRGFLLGDGRLNYGHETIVESYYRAQVGRFVQLSADVQHIWNPGYNHDRGPASVFTMRLNLRY